MSLSHPDIRLTLFSSDRTDAFASSFLPNNCQPVRDECSAKLVDCGIKSGVTFVTDESQCDMDSSKTPDVVPCSTVDASGE